MKRGKQVRLRGVVDNPYDVYRQCLKTFKTLKLFNTLLVGQFISTKYKSSYCVIEK